MTLQFVRQQENKTPVSVMWLGTVLCSKVNEAWRRQMLMYSSNNGAHETYKAESQLTLDTAKSARTKKNRGVGVNTARQEQEKKSAYLCKTGICSRSAHSVVKHDFYFVKEMIWTVKKSTFCIPFVCLVWSIYFCLKSSCTVQKKILTFNGIRWYLNPLVFFMLLIWRIVN